MMKVESNMCKASVKMIPMCHYKMQSLVALVRGMMAKEAVTQLAFSKKTGAYYLSKVISSCIANGIIKGMNPEKLVVAIAVSNKGPTYKRFMARGRGRSTRIEKRNSSLFVALKEFEATHIVKPSAEAEAKKVGAKKKSS